MSAFLSACLLLPLLLLPLLLLLLLQLLLLLPLLLPVFINESEKRCLYNHVWWPPPDPPRTIAVQRSNCKLPLCREFRARQNWHKFIIIIVIILSGARLFAWAWHGTLKDRQAAAASSIYEPQTVCPFFFFFKHNRL